MKADHHQAPARQQQINRRFQALFELLKLGIDKNSERLEGPRGRVLARFAGFDGASHDLAERRGGANGVPAFAPSNKRLCNLDSKPFFAIVFDHFRNVALVGAG